MGKNISYFLSGRVIPERALLDIGEAKFVISGSDEVPEGTLTIEIIASQILARFEAEVTVQNLFTLRNAVERHSRILLDVAGFFYGYSYDVEIIQLVDSGNQQKIVFGIDVPVLDELVQSSGIEISDVFYAITKPDGHYLSEAFSDLRESIKNPRDTGFFCYRAIETLKNRVAKDKGLDLKRENGWEAFREEYGISRSEIMLVKKYADLVRHGPTDRLVSISDTERAKLLTGTWKIVIAYLSKDEDTD